MATATSLVVMGVNAAVATSAAPRSVTGQLRSRWLLLVLLAVGGVIGAWASQSVPAGVLRWGFVTYLAVTVVDLLVQPGFFRPRTVRAEAEVGAGHRQALPDGVAVVIGAIAAFLGVGGSVMTVPALRRGGVSMATAVVLANPLTLAIVTPAAVVALLAGPTGAGRDGVVGSVDLEAAAALLVGSVPTVALLRRYPLVVADAVHAWGYLLLLLAAGTAVALR